MLSFSAGGSQTTLAARAVWLIVVHVAPVLSSAPRERSSNILHKITTAEWMNSESLIRYTGIFVNRDSAPETPRDEP